LIIAQIIIQMSVGVTAEAGLSYIGLGVQPPTPSWGRMLNDAQTFIADAPWLAIFPGLAIILTVLTLSLLADAIGPDRTMGTRHKAIPAPDTPDTAS
jgi:peptide/nickel transport system permease protein